MLRKPHRLRVILLGAVFTGLFGAVTARLYDLQYAKNEHYEQRAERQHWKRVVLQPERGDILDRNGNALAHSTGRLTVYVDPRYFRAPHSEVDLDQIARFVADSTNAKVDSVRARLNGNAPVSIGKRLRNENAQRIVELFDGLGVDGRGYWLHRESIRLYPRRTAAPIVGFCSTDGDGDNIGLAGIEYQFNEQLKGQKIVGTSLRSAISETMQPVSQDDVLSARGNTLVLTLDSNIQEVCERTLEKTVLEFEAKSAGAVVMDTNSGAVLAMATYPTFDNNSYGEAPAAHRKNTLLTDPLETGSVAKLFMAAILLDLGIIAPETLIDCEGGYAVVDGRHLRDSPGHYLNVVPFREALRWSSNIGIVKAAQPLDNRTWYDYLRRFGFGGKTGIDLPGEGEGILYPVEKWTKFSRTSLPMGYEIALTPVQISAALGAIVNGGNYYEPYLVQEVRDSRGSVIHRHSAEPARQVVRPTTSAILREMMEDVVDNGTGKKAQVPGYRIGGKTGTTRKSNIFDRREYISSFGGVLPINAPRVTIYLYVDSPKKAYYASTVAAPAFQEIARAVTLHLGILPTEDPSAQMASADIVETPRKVTRNAFSARYADIMPDLRGMSMASVRERLPRSVSNVKFLGSGLLADQYPPPGEPLGSESKVVLVFSPDHAPAESRMVDTVHVAATGAYR